MALTVREKLKLQKIVRGKGAELEQGGLKIREKLAAQREMREALEKLNAKIDAGADNQLLRDLLDGKFNNLNPVQFIGKLKEVVASLDGDIEPTKPGAVGYVNAKIEQGELILESAAVQAILEAAKPKRPTVPAKDQRKITDILHEYGTKRHKNIPIGDIFDDILRAGYVPLQEDGTEWDGMLTGAKGRASIPIAQKKQGHRTSTMYPESEWMRQYLHIQWYRDGNESTYEFNGYIA